MTTHQPAAHWDGVHQAGGMTWGYSARPALGSLFSGAGLLDLAVSDVFGTRTAWVVEKDPAASRVLDARFGVPNHQDVTATDWGVVEPVDIIAGGYPCQGESNAGKRLGDADPRWMWPAYRDAIAALRPKLAVGENVRSHLGRSFRHVIADLLTLGYAVVWGVVAASDVGACHERKRLWWLAWPQEYGPPTGLGTVPFAHLDGGAMVTDDLFGGAPTTDWPTAGAAYAGAAYAGAAYAGAAPGGELLPTVRTSDTNGAGAHGDGGLDLRTAVAMLPTPDAGHGRKQTRSGPLLAGAVELLPTPSAAGAFNDGEDVDQWEARRARQAERGINGNGMGLPLTIAVQMLPTPNATDAQGGPRAVPEHRTSRGSDHGPRLRDIAAALLPSPAAADANGHDFRGGSRSAEPLLPGAVQPERFGAYAPAVARWEALTRPAPDPTVPGRNGKPRLNPAFAEWLMGAPAGWITGMDGVTRTDALRIAGNGVVRQQGAGAFRWLAGRLPVALRLALDLAPDDAASVAPALKEATT